MLVNRLLTGDPFVAFVGAGASAIPPSSLPTWTAFNNLVLECLCEKLAEYSDHRQPTGNMLAMLQSRRDESSYFSPDFQAQLMEDQLGEAYFKVWQSIDSTVVSPVHEDLAQLCAQGRIAAIVTTNFDTLIKLALQARGVTYRVFHDVESFESLRSAGLQGPLPVIKIHGSIEDPASLVDTLRQRVVGRPDALQVTLDVLLCRHTWLYLGFSGADFSHVPNYLNVLGSASEARGFVFLSREGDKPQAGVARLLDAYGADRASLVTGDLGTWLHTQFAMPRPRGANKPGTESSVSNVKVRIAEWVQGLRPMATVNVLCSMLKSCGRHLDALWLMRKTWKSYRQTGDTEGPSYLRYNLNYGLSLLEAGSISNPIALAEDRSNLLEWKTYADQNAYEFLARAYHLGKIPAAGANAARALALRGDTGKAVVLLADATEVAHATGPGLDFCDVVIASCDVYDILQMILQPIPQLRLALELLQKLGDEPRRAQMHVLLARFLAYAAQWDEAKENIDEARILAQRFALADSLLAVQAVEGMWLAEQRLSQESASEAIRLLQEVATALRTKDAEPLFVHVDLAQANPTPTHVLGHSPQRCRVLLDLNRAAIIAGDADAMKSSLQELDGLVWDSFLGYCPHFLIAYAECVAVHGDGDVRSKVEELLRQSLEVGETTENIWVPQAVQKLRDALTRHLSTP